VAAVRHGSISFAPAADCSGREVFFRLSIISAQLRGMLVGENTD
jgi:hypothetical protein